MRVVSLTSPEVRSPAEFIYKNTNKRKGTNERRFLGSSFSDMLSGTTFTAPASYSPEHQSTLETAKLHHGRLLVLHLRSPR